MQKSIIIVAGGSGSRMKSSIPKQFIEIAGKPILFHTINKFYEFDQSIPIIIVLPENQFEYWNFLVKTYSFQIPVILSEGGETRYHSVKNGLDYVKTEIVGIHDAVRPLVSFETIKNTFELAEKKGNAIPVISINDSIRLTDNLINKPIDRNLVKIVQTPQCFNTNLLKKAYLQGYDESFTDDASVLEKTGVSINLSEGNRENIKITQPSDLAIAELFLQNKS